jgi:putative tryptophan/tyrosine transport system substrate-binding protein
MRRREFITLLGGAAVIWPFAAAAQRDTSTTIGFLHGSSAEGQAFILPAFRRGLSDAGHVRPKPDR